MNTVYLSNQFSGCFEIFAKFNNINTENFKYVKTQFYSKVLSNQKYETPQMTIQNHKYQRVSIPRSYYSTPKYQQKGIIFIWPQKRKFFKYKELIYLAWLTSHLLFWLHTLNLLPSGGVLPIEQPPWNFELPIRKPDTRDYIIEPDWDSNLCS